MEQDAKVGTDFDSKANDFYASKEAEAPTTPSVDTKPEETTQPEPKGAEPSKTDKAIGDGKVTLTTEERIAKIQEMLGDDPKAIEAYIKKMGYHKDPAWQKLLQKSKAPLIDEETQKQLETFKQVSNTPEYIATMMKHQGYTQEAIDNTLREKGFRVESKPSDDLQLIADKLGVKPESFDDNTRNIISDVAKLADIIVQDRLSKVLPDALNPITSKLTETEQNNNATKMLSDMKAIVSEKGLVDFEKDIEPNLSQWIDENPEATQQEIFDHFKILNYEMTIERLETKGRKDDRDSKKSDLRSSRPGVPVAPTRDVKRLSGKWSEKEVDRIAEELGIR